MKPDRDKYDILVIGGGFFGLNIACHFAAKGKVVLVCERGSLLMSRASYVNQARIHNGYHYPRSILTAQRSCASFPRFVKDFSECVVSDFEKYYAIGKILGKINARQFETFCRRIGAPCETAPESISSLFDSHYIEKVFRVKEYAFNAEVLCKLMKRRLAKVGVEVLIKTPVTGLSSRSVDGSGGLRVSLNGETEVLANHVFNCTYSNINFFNNLQSLPLIPLKYEMTEMALVEMPAAVEGKAFTVMCGPFFSVMPFPSRNCYSLSHVRYTPHYEWRDEGGRYVSPLDIYDRDEKRTSYVEMVKDAARYLPSLSKCRYKESIWEVKTVLPSSEIDDSRPILCKLNYGRRGYHCIMGGKIDNIYDIVSALEQNKEMFV